MAKLFSCLRRLTLALGLLYGASSQAGNLALVDIHGQQLEVDNHWLLINYWATWCKPCRAEVPELNQLHDQLQGHSISILGFNFDQLEGDALQQASAELDIGFPVLTNQSMQQIDVPGTMGLPVTFLLNPKGEFVDRLLGEQNRASLLQALQEAKALPADFSSVLD